VDHDDYATVHGCNTGATPDGTDVVAMATNRRTSQLVHDGDEVRVIKIPRTYDEAMAGPDREKWAEACQTEIDAHMRVGTWRLLSMKQAMVNSKKKVVGSTWTFDIKRNADGTVARYKARLCAQGFSQIENIDYINTYSNTCRHTTLRMLFAVAAAMGLRLTSCDVVTAYLYGFIEDNITILMRQPRGFEKYSDDGEPMICHLVRSIYGLRQSGARWEARLTQRLIEIGFARSPHDPCLYKITRDGELLLCCVYVDDLAFASSSDKLRAEIMDELCQEFKIKDTGPLTWMLNTKVCQDLEAGTVSISQKLFIDDTVASFFPEGLPKEKKRLVPCDDSIAEVAPLAEGEMIDPRYRKGVGKLVWLVSITRPDVAYTLSLLSRHCQAAGARHMVHLLQAISYVGHTSHYKITYSKSNTAKLWKLLEANSSFKGEVFDYLSMVCLADSSHGGERAMAGYIHYLFGGPIAWRAYRSAVTSLSSCEDEYMNTSTATVETLSLRGEAEFMGINVDTPTMTFCDNKSAVQLADGNSSSKRMKHIATRIAFLREQIAAKAITMLHISAAGQLADIFTKYLTANIFHAIRNYMIG